MTYAIGVSELQLVVSKDEETSTQAPEIKRQS